MSTKWLWTGALTHNSVRIKAAIDGVNARLAVATNEALRYPTYYESTVGMDQSLSLTGSGYVQTPDKPSLDITDNIDIIAHVRPDTYTPNGTYAIVSKYTTSGTQRAWQCSITNAGALRLSWSTSGGNYYAADSSEPIPATDGQSCWVRVASQRSGSTRTTRFYTSRGGAGWTQFGDAVVSTGAAGDPIYGSSAPVMVGSSNEGNSDGFTGEICSVTVKDGIEGSIVAYADFSRRGNGWSLGDGSGESYDDPYGNTWTSSGTIDIVESPGSIIEWDLPDLQPGTRYWVAIEDEGELDPTWKGRFRTYDGPPGTPVSHKIASWSCSGLRPRFPGALPTVGNHPALDVVTDEHQPDLLVQTGDIHYGDINVPDYGRYRTALEGVLSRDHSERMSRHLALNPTVYVWDDHDFGPNDSDRTSPGGPYAQQAYADYVPHLPLERDDGMIYHSQQIGRVLHLFSDVRSARDPREVPDSLDKTMLGEAQIQWMDNLLSTTDAEFLVWYMPSQWMGTGIDTWSNWSVERNRLVDLLRAPGGDADKDWTHRMCQVSGDVHAIALDDGGGNKWGGFPVYVCASMDSDGANMQDGIYMQNGRYQTSNPGRGRYGIIDITDTGSAIEIEASLYIGRWRNFHHRWAVDLTPDSPLESFSASEVEAVAEIDWSKGTYFGRSSNVPDGYQTQTITDWSISRELSTDLPDDVRTSTGLSVAEAKTNIAAPSGATLGHWSPWRNPLRYLNAPTKLSVIADGETYPQFVGKSTAAQSDANGVLLESTAYDEMADYDRPIDMPAFAGKMGPNYNPGISSEWVIEHVLSQFGGGALWPQGPNCAYYLSLAGSTMTSVGGWERSRSPQTANQAPTFVYAPDMPYRVPSYFGCVLSGSADSGSSTDQDDESSSTGWTIGAISGAPVGEVNSNFIVHIRLEPRDAAWSRYIAVQHYTYPGYSYLNVSWKYDGIGETIHEVRFEDIELGPWWVTYYPTSSGWQIAVYQQGMEPRTALLPTDVNINVETAAKSSFASGNRTTTLGLQILRGGHYTQDELPVYERDKARISVPDIELVGVPPLDKPTGKQVLQDLASAELGAFWIDEEGTPVYESRSDLRGLNKEPIPVYSEQSLLDAGTWNTSIDQIRSRVEVPMSTPRVNISLGDYQDVWEAEEVITVMGKETLDIIIDLPQPVGGVSYGLWTNPNTSRSYFRGNRAPDGSGSIVITTQGGRVYQLTATRVRVVWTNPFSYPVHFVHPDGKPAFVIRARWFMEAGEEITVAQDTGQEGTVLTMENNPWRQVRSDGLALARWVADDVSAPRPYLENLKVSFDPRIRLGSVISLRDPDNYGVNIKCLVRAVDINSEAGSIIQTISAQPLRLTLAEVDAAHRGLTMSDIDNYWTQTTLGDFDRSPLDGGSNAHYA